MTTIIVDDDQRNRQHVRAMLERAGHRTREFETADAAYADLVTAGAECSLVVTDVQMPGVRDGVDLALALADARPEVPVIVMSAAAGELRRSRAAGLSGPTLLKPIAEGDLLAAVRGHATEARSEMDARPRTFADPGRSLVRMYRVAERAGDPHVGSEHLALAAIEGPGGLREIAARAGVDPDQLPRALAGCCPHPKVTGDAGATFRVARLVAIASHMASIEDCCDVQPRHLVQALLTTPIAVAWRGLAAAGLDHRTVRHALALTEKASQPAGPLTEVH